MLLTPNEGREANSYGEMLRLAVHERRGSGPRCETEVWRVPFHRYGAPIMQFQLCLRMDCTRRLPHRSDRHLIRM